MPAASALLILLNALTSPVAGTHALDSNRLVMNVLQRSLEAALGIAAQANSSKTASSLDAHSVPLGEKSFWFMVMSAVGALGGQRACPFVNVKAVGERSAWNMCFVCSDDVITSIDRAAGDACVVFRSATSLSGCACSL